MGRRGHSQESSAPPPGCPGPPAPCRTHPRCPLLHEGAARGVLPEPRGSPQGPGLEAGASLGLQEACCVGASALLPGAPSGTRTRLTPLHPGPVAGGCPRAASPQGLSTDAPWDVGHAGTGPRLRPSLPGPGCGGALPARPAGGALGRTGRSLAVARSIHLPPRARAVPPGCGGQRHGWRPPGKAPTARETHCAASPLRSLEAVPCRRSPARSRLGAVMLQSWREPPRRPRPSPGAARRRRALQSEQTRLASGSAASSIMLRSVTSSSCSVLLPRPENTEGGGLAAAPGSRGDERAAVICLSVSRLCGWKSTIFCCLCKLRRVSDECPLAGRGA